MKKGRGVLEQGVWETVGNKTPDGGQDGEWSDGFCDGRSETCREIAWLMVKVREGNRSPGITGPVVELSSRLAVRLGAVGSCGEERGGAGCHKKKHLMSSRACRVAS
jgi:hypothetical protein